MILFLLITLPIRNWIFSMLEGASYGATYCGNLYSFFSICTVYTVLQAQADYYVLHDFKVSGFWSLPISCKCHTYRKFIENQGLYFSVYPKQLSGVYTPIEISSFTYGMKLKLRPKILLDKRCWLMASSLWSRDPVYFTDGKPFLLTSWKIEKWRHQSISFVKGTYRSNFQVGTTFGSQEVTWSLIFPHKTWHVNSYHPKKNSLNMLRGHVMRAFWFQKLRN